MRKGIWTFGVVIFALVASLYSAPIARADDFSCRGTVGAITVDNLVVPDGATCTLLGTRVEGTIVVETGATLRAFGVRVDGNIQAEGARAVNVLAGSIVGGSIQINQGGRARIDQTFINGDLQLEQNTGPLLVTRNRIGGNAQINQNSGGVFIAVNRIAENLQCQANRPAPTGGGNVAGDKEDQCASL